MKSNSICDTGRRRSLPQRIQHLLLQIYGDDEAAVPNDPLPSQPETDSHSATHIHDGHPRLDVEADDLFRVMDYGADAGDCRI